MSDLNDRLHHQNAVNQNAVNQNIDDMNTTGTVGTLTETVGKGLELSAEMGETAREIDPDVVAITARGLKQLGTLADMVDKLGSVVGAEKSGSE